MVPNSVPSLEPSSAPALQGPTYLLGRGVVFGLVALLLGITQGLGQNLVNSNLPGVQGSLGLTPTEVSWLSTAYFSTNISAAILMTKVRMQFGLRPFTYVMISLYVVLAVAHLLSQSPFSAIAVRAALGLAAAPISSLTVLYMIQAVPPGRAPVGAVLGFGALQLGAPLSRVISEDVLQIGQWMGLNMVDVALALACAGALHALPLPHVPAKRAFERGDLIVFPLYAASLALFCIVLTQGRLHWWSDTPWLGQCLVAAIVCFGLYVVLEIHRESPLLDLRWLTSPFMLQFMLAILVFRVGLSEQTVGAVGLLNSLGFTNDQLHPLFILITCGTVIGFLIAVLVSSTGRFRLLGDVALALIVLAAWKDSHSTVLTRPDDFYVSQTVLAMASGMYLSAAALIGFGRVIQEGMKNLVSFTAVFSGGQALATIAGTAWLSTLLADQQRLRFSELAGQLSLSDPLVALRVAQLGGALGSRVNDVGARMSQGLALFAQQVTQQSFALAYNDLFRAVALSSTLGFAVFLSVRTHRHLRQRRSASRTVN